MFWFAGCLAVLLLAVTKGLGVSSLKEEDYSDIRLEGIMAYVACGQQEEVGWKDRMNRKWAL